MPVVRTDELRAKKNSLRERFDIEGGKGLIYWLFLLLVLSIPVSIIAFDRVMHVGHHTVFLPDDVRQGYTDACDTRGTINIVWACFSTIFTCVYVSLHLDVPYYEKEPVGWKEKGWAALKTGKRKGCWIVINILAPELVAYVAVVEFTSARSWRRRTVEYCGIDDAVWTLEHQFFADMGGFKVPVIREEPRKEEGSTDDRPAMEGQNVSIHGRKKSRGSDPDVVIIRSGWDFELWLNNNKSAIDSICFAQAAIDIQNGSKADWLLKSLTILQASWLVVQSIVRVIEGRPVSELEVTTCAYVACAIFTYGFWWNKPYGLQKHVLLQMLPTPRPHWTQNTYPTPFNRIWIGGVRVELTAVILSGCIGSAIGAIHSTLWNATFSNTNGQLLWRICCIAQIVAPIVTSAFLAWRERYHHYGFNAKVTLRNRLLAAAFAACFVQFCARIVIFILIGYSFRSLPAGVYRDVDWTWSWFPHIH